MLQEVGSTAVDRVATTTKTMDAMVTRVKAVAIRTDNKVEVGHGLVEVVEEEEVNFVLYSLEWFYFYLATVLSRTSHWVFGDLTNFIYY